MFDILLRKVAKGLDGQRIPYMVIGGQAILLYGTPRLTRDIDITVGIDIDKLPLMAGLCGDLRLKTIPKNAKEFVSKTMVLPTEDPKTRIRVDFIFSCSEYEKAALKRTLKAKIRGYPVAFASPEDLVIHKIFSGRAIDLEDVRNILVKRGKKKVDIGYIRKWLWRFQEAQGRSDMVSAFDEILADINS